MMRGPMLRYLFEVVAIIVLEILVVTRLHHDMPDVGLFVGIAIPTLIFIFELTHHNASILHKEGLKVLEYIGKQADDWRLGDMAKDVREIGNQTRLVSAVILKDMKEPALFASQYFDAVYSDAVDQLSGMIDGRFTINGRSPEYIWNSHYSCIAKSSPGIDFWATCLVPKTKEGIDFVFGNDSFNEYCRLSYSKLDKGHISEIRKIFIMEKADDIKVSALLSRHLQEVIDVARRMNTNKFYPKVFIFEEALRRGQSLNGVEDFMIWGKELVVTSRMGDGNLLLGLDCCTVASEIDRKRMLFNRIYQDAKHLDDVLL